MRSIPFRWRVLGPTLVLAAVVAAALVGLVHLRSDSQRRNALTNTLASKTEEVYAVLAADRGSFDLASFLELETRYASSPYEYFFELCAPDGRVLLCSENLPQAGLGPLAEVGTAPLLGRRPHPRSVGEEVLVRTQRLPLDVAHGDVAGPVVRVAACLAPLLAASRADLRSNVLAAALALVVLAGALWFVVGRSLRSVSAITRHAASISGTNLRERLPRSGSGDELDRLSEVLNELFAGLERSLAQMESFTADAAHQLRTPLTRIRGELDLVLARPGDLPEETRLSLEAARSELERLVETCARLLLLARLDRGALVRELRGERLDLAVLAQELVEQVAPLAAEKGVDVRLGTSGSAPLRGSRALLAEALLNLLDNAIRYTPPGGRIEVAVHVEGREVLASVQDSGPGFDAQEQALVFRRFFRGRDGGSASGTGLGLAIVRGIARAHGGEAELASATGTGAHFRLRLPAA